MAATYDYSLVRVVPDRRRGEWVNVGICVFLADRLDLHLLTNTSKLRVLAPAFDLTFLEDLPSLWEAICGNVDGVEERHAILSRLPLAHASGVAKFVAAPGAYQSEIDAILRDLVMPPPAPLRAIKEPRLITALKRHFINSDLYSSNLDDIQRHRVVQNYPIQAGAGLYADFALKNGALRITETIDFRVSRDALRNKHGQSAIKAITLDKAVHIHQKCVPSVVYAGSPETLDLIQPSLNLLAGYAERLYDANSPQDMATYMEMMQSASRS